MEKIKLLTDSGSDLPLSLAEKLDIEIIPIQIRGNGADFSNCYSEDTSLFWAKLKTLEKPPELMEITPVTYLNRYVAALKAGHTHIICVTIGSEINGSYRSALVARDLFYEENAGAAIVEIIDSHSFSLAYGDLVAAASRIRAAGGGYAKICAMLQSELPRREMLFHVYDTEQIGKGKLGGRTALAGGSFGLRPVFLCTEHGDIEMVAKAAPGEGSAKMLALLVSELGKHGDEPVSVLIGEVPKEDSDLLIKAIGEELSGKEVFFVPLGCTAAVFLGGAALGTVYNRS